MTAPHTPNLAQDAIAERLQAVIDAHTEGPLLGFIGQPHVNVLMTNRALDARFTGG